MRWFPNDFFRQLLAGRFASSLLEFREVLLSLIRNLLQRHYCFFNSYLVSTIPKKPTVGDKEFSSFLVLQRQLEKIKERKKLICRVTQLIKVSSPDHSYVLTIPQGMNHCLGLPLTVEANIGLNYLSPCQII